MAKKTYMYSEVVSADTSDQKLVLPALKKFSVKNNSDVDIDINIDNSISDSDRKKFTLSPSGVADFGAGHSVLHYQATSGSGKELQVLGERMVRE